MGKVIVYLDSEELMESVDSILSNDETEVVEPPCEILTERIDAIDWMFRYLSIYDIDALIVDDHLLKGRLVSVIAKLMKRYPDLYIFVFTASLDTHRLLFSNTNSRVVCIQIDAQLSKTITDIGTVLNFNQQVATY
ncbi:hypothetical protein HOH87_05340 [bacterium]|mgnify:CR=1 FL=1|jgi:sulfur relay (sulfurtransferase) DsrF/TusC family protein|nr:hypothetical protein [bacterium]